MACAFNVAAFGVDISNFSSLTGPRLAAGCPGALLSAGLPTLFALVLQKGGIYVILYMQWMCIFIYAGLYIFFVVSCCPLDIWGMFYLSPTHQLLLPQPFSGRPCLFRKQWSLFKNEFLNIQVPFLFSVWALMLKVIAASFISWMDYI